MTANMLVVTREHTHERAELGCSMFRTLPEELRKKSIQRSNREILLSSHHPGYGKLLAGTNVVKSSACRERALILY